MNELVKFSFDGTKSIGDYKVKIYSPIKVDSHLTFLNLFRKFTSSSSHIALIGKDSDINLAIGVLTFQDLIEEIMSVKLYKKSSRSHFLKDESLKLKRKISSNLTTDFIQQNSFKLNKLISNSISKKEFVDHNSRDNAKS